MQLYPFQESIVKQVLTAPLHRWLISAEPGLGKSAMSITVARELGAKHILIIAPAVTRIGWTRELDIWWPGHPEARVISLGLTREKGLSKPALERKLAAYSAPIQIVSYDLVDQVATDGWHYIILDEAHRLKNPMAKQTQAVMRIVHSNPKAAAVALTGTPMADKPTDIHSPLHILFPGRFGELDRSGRASYKFNTRYSNATHNGFGYSYTGINELHVDELRSRLAAVSTRVTKKEVAAFLPALLTQTVRIPPVKGDFKMRGRDEAALEQSLMRIGEEKLGPTLDWLEDHLQASNKVVVFTYGVALAQEIAEKASKIKGAPPVFCITGAIPADKRQGLVDAFKNAPKALCVASMKSIGIGINGLDCATDVLFAELYYRPETLEQALGRFNRLSSTEPTTISLLILEATMDEVLAVKLLNKCAAINSAIKPGAAGEGLSTALAQTESEEQFLAELENYTNTPIDELDYVT